MILDQRAKAIRGPTNGVKARIKPFQDKLKGIILNKIKKFLLTFDVIVETRKRNTGGTTDIAHGSRLKASFRKDLGRMQKNMLEFGFGIARSRDGNSHEDIERSFN